MRKLSKQGFFLTLACAAVRDVECDDQGILAFMALLHTHCVEVHPDIALSDAGEHRVLAGLTRRHLGTLIAEVLGPELGDRSNYMYWDLRYQREVGFEIAEQITAEWSTRIEAIATLLQAKSLIVAIAADDD